MTTETGPQGAQALQDLLAKRNPAALDSDTQVPTVTIVEPQPIGAFKVEKGETLFEPSFEQAPVITALPSGKRVSLPYATSDKEEVDFLTEFAKHCGLVTITEGV